MNRYLSKLVALCILTFGLVGKGVAQRMNFLIPDAIIVQYAGSIGYGSLGFGYEIFKNKRGYIDLNYGYVPASKGGELHTLTAKFAYKPIEIKMKEWGKLYPFNPGVFLSYSFHEDLPFKFHSSQYPSGYYYWSPALRPHLSFSNEIELNMERIWSGTGIKKVGIYSEFNTNDYYIINYFQNIKALSLADVFQLGVGIRFKF
ncbi:hypothetical protein ACFX5U_16785 [Sphingobacterium sp. SG20118]|uniref:hypothetical protein n=1 Tax=Sphingobacterium sp. SG20118 TaxID=3367156 RepID=UPI0037DFCA15